jgi:hypothetical protein
MPMRRELALAQIAEQQILHFVQDDNALVVKSDCLMLWAGLV